MPIPDNPQTRQEMYLNGIATGSTDGLPDSPVTREEMYLNGIARGSTSGLPESPQTRTEMYLDYIAKNGGGGGGGGDITVESKSIDSNGTYTAPSGKAYSPVTVNVPASAVDSGTKSITSNGTNQDVVGYAAVDVSVPNSYAAGDEGKVVSNGELVSQTAHAEAAANGTIDTTLNNSVVVNVPNSYAAGDEGKVVSNGELVAQTSDSVTQNGMVDTTLINSLLVNVPSGGVKIANGTFTGNGSNSYEGLNVGSKMPLCDFVLNVWAPDGTEFAYNDTYKAAVFSGLVSKHFVKYVPVIDSFVAPTFQIQHDINNDGTITSIYLASKGSGLQSDVRNGSTGGSYLWVADAVKLKQTASAFYLRLQCFNNQHKFVSGMTYNWEIIYYGADPTHDIAEVA